MIHLYEVTRKGKFIETETRLARGGWGKGYCIMVPEFLFRVMKIVVMVVLHYELINATELHT